MARKQAVHTPVQGLIAGLLGYIVYVACFCPRERLGDFPCLFVVGGCVKDGNLVESWRDRGQKTVLT